MRNEVLDWMKEALEGDEAERVLKAALGHEEKLYERFGSKFTEFLQNALKHENEKVVGIASTLLSQIPYTYG